VRGAGDSDERRRDVLGGPPLTGHLIQVRGVHVSVVVPAETVKRDEQQLVPGGPGGPGGPGPRSVSWWKNSTERVANEAEDGEEEQHYR